MRALDVANYLIYLTKDTFDDMSNMKINKLLYFCQGYFLKEYGRTLFDDDIEAWEHGPVVPSVYSVYKKYGEKSIDSCNEESVALLKEEEKKVIYKVVRNYGRYTASYLREITHALGSPWDAVYTPNVPHIVIPVRSMKEYFQKKEEEITLSERKFTDEDFVGYRDKDGILVLPKDWDDE